jgi:hypothetical protein
MAAMATVTARAAKALREIDMVFLLECLTGENGAL